MTARWFNGDTVTLTEVCFFVVFLSIWMSLLPAALLCVEKNLEGANCHFQPTGTTPHPPFVSPFCQPVPSVPSSSICLSVCRQSTSTERGCCWYNDNQTFLVGKIQRLYSLFLQNEEKEENRILNFCCVLVKAISLNVTFTERSGTTTSAELFPKAPSKAPIKMVSMRLTRLWFRKKIFFARVGPPRPEFSSPKNTPELLPQGSSLFAQSID